MKTSTRGGKAAAGKKAAPKSGASRFESLFAAVYDAPDDLTRRVVLGDALLDAGDPRGELIAHHKRRLDAGVQTPTKHERDLLKKHGDAWLGALSSVLRSPQFHLGFVSGGTLKGGRHDIEALRRLREWRTVERLMVSGALMAEEILSMPELVSLREVGNVTTELVEAVIARRGKLAWTHVTSLSPLGPGGDPFEAFAELAPSLPKLKHLKLGDSAMMSMTFDLFERILATKLVTQLERLELVCEPGAVDEILQAAASRGLRSVVIDARDVGTVVWDGSRKTVSAPAELELELPAGVERVDAQP